MMLPFTRDEFFDLFAAYNAVAWPAIIISYFLAMTALALAWRGTPHRGRMVAAMLAMMWGWVGIVYHGLFFATINPPARFFAAGFVLQALLFAWASWTGRGLDWGARSRLQTGAGGALLLYALVIYPLIGLATGERYPAMPLFGITPCPLLIFTFGLMLWAGKVRWWLWIVPLGWSVIGGSAAFLLFVPQDWALPLSAIAALVFARVEHHRRLNPTA